VHQAAAARVSDYLVKPFSRSVFELRLGSYRARFKAQILVRSSAESVAGAGALRQQDIDALMIPVGIGGAAGTARTARVLVDSSLKESLPKGLAPATVAVVLQALAAREVSSASDVATAAGMARGTARRYLDFLLAEGTAIVTHRYGVRGRPELLYSLAPEAMRTSP
jgi:response regulator of citrate/malate metabolism